MPGQSFVDQLKARFGEQITGANLTNIDPWIEIAPQSIVDVCWYLRDEPSLAFDYLNCISGVDYYHTDEKKAAKADWQPHLEVVYHLYSFPLGKRLRVKAGVEERAPEIASLVSLWPAADWLEREVWDMYGIRFAGHPDPRRLLLYEEFRGHPLRKDYAKEKRQPLLGPEN